MSPNDDDGSGTVLAGATRHCEWRRGQLRGEGSEAIMMSMVLVARREEMVGDEREKRRRDLANGDDGVPTSFRRQGGTHGVGEELAVPMKTTAWPEGLQWRW